MNWHLGIDTRVTLLAAGLIFLLALFLGVWKYRQITVAPDHRAHPTLISHIARPCSDSFATLLLATFVELSAWPTWVNLTAAMVVVFFVVGAVADYIIHGALRDTTNQFEHASRGSQVAMALLIGGEIGGFGVLLAGFIAGQLVT